MKFFLIVFGVLANQNQTEQILSHLENRVMNNSKEYLQVLNQKFIKTFTKFEKIAEKITA